MRKLKLGVLGSGKGSNFGAILEKITAGKMNAEVAIVLSDVETAGILRLAREAGVPHAFVHPGSNPRLLASRAQDEIRDRLLAAGVDLVILAGFMRVLKAPILEAFPDRVLNVHPSLRPDFKGVEAWKQALTAGAAETGCTVHIVNEEIDAGRILAQAKASIVPGETAESLQRKIQLLEHTLYPEAIETYGSRMLASIPQ